MNSTKNLIMASVKKLPYHSLLLPHEHAKQLTSPRRGQKCWTVLQGQYYSTNVLYNYDIAVFQFSHLRALKGPKTLHKRHRRPYFKNILDGGRDRRRGAEGCKDRQTNIVRCIVACLPLKRARPNWPIDL